MYKYLKNIKKLFLFIYKKSYNLFKFRKYHFTFYNCNNKTFFIMKGYIVTGVLTNIKLNAYELSKRPKIKFLCSTEVKPGDMIRSKNYDKSIEVLNVNTISDCHTDQKDLYVDYESFFEDNGIDTLEIFSINDEYVKETQNNIFTNNYKKDSNMNTISNSRNGNEMLSGIFDKYKAQFIPTREDGIRMSFTGLICVPVGDEYIGIDNDNTLTSFPEAMTIKLPFYSINKNNNAVKIGDIVKEGRSYAKVIGKNTDGSLKVLTYSGYNRNKKEVKDFLMNQSTTRVIINMFNFDNTNENSFNPLFFAYMTGDKIDVNSLMLLSMTPQGKNLFSNIGGGFNPMFLYLLDSNKSEKSSMMEMMLMMQLMGGNQSNNPMANFSGLFGMNNMTQVHPEQMIVEEPESDDYKEKDADVEQPSKFSIDDAIEMIMKNPDAVAKLKKTLNKKTNK